jgi:hypothetical protein
LPRRVSRRKGAESIEAGLLKHFRHLVNSGESFTGP